MASENQIHRAFQALGDLFAAEHEEHDDAGARQVQRLTRLLRKFAKHEQAEQHAQPSLFGGVREATYQLGDGRTVYYDDGPIGKETLQDAADLYTVLDELHGTGSPNLENMQAREILGRLQTGNGLGEIHIGTLRKLLAKHAGAISRLRRSRDRDGQDLLAVASGGPDSRIDHSTTTEA